VNNKMKCIKAIILILSSLGYVFFKCYGNSESANENHWSFKNLLTTTFAGLISKDHRLFNASGDSVC
jgi:hypothetical protein